MSAPGMASIEVPVMHKVGPDGSKAGGELVEVAIWSDTCQGIDQGDAIATWLCAFLEMVRACVRGGYGVASGHVGLVSYCSLDSRQGYPSRQSYVYFDPSRAL